MRKILIWLDDERKIPQSYSKTDFIILHCKDYNSAVEAVELSSRRNAELFVDLDHDLGQKSLSGYDFCLYLVSNDVNAKYRLHTMNPVGRRNMEQLLENYNYGRF